MIKIGILPATQINEKDNPYNDIYMFSNEVAKWIFKAGALPIGIILNNGKLDLESLKICDAFLIGGGKKIEPYFLETIHYAIKNNKPLLGICLGMQAIGVYSYLESLLKKNDLEFNIQNFYKMFDRIKEEKVQLLIPVENHYNEKITRSNYSVNKHYVEIHKNSKLFDMYKKRKIDVISLHRYAIDKIGDSVFVNCHFNNTVEGLEYKDKNLFILGVQWHPELEEENTIILKTLVKESKRRKNEI